MRAWRRSACRGSPENSEIPSEVACAIVFRTRIPRDVVTGMWEEAAVHLEQSGVPVRLHVPILDGVEKLRGFLFGVTQENRDAQAL